MLHFVCSLLKISKYTQPVVFVFFLKKKQIYTEWANYYLERKSKRKIVDLSEDIRDGLLLAELIEVVTSYKVNDLTKKPKTQKQMVSCLIKEICNIL